jgi:hypothetical protein
MKNKKRKQIDKKDKEQITAMFLLAVMSCEDPIWYGKCALK